MSFPSLWPTLPPLATVARFASVTETSTGKLLRFEAPDTFPGLIVSALRLLQDVLYQLDPVMVKVAVATALSIIPL